jgi:mannose-1-phosphate guanylyltransferase
VLPDLGDDAYLIEPRARGTAPVLTWAAWEIARRDPDAVIISLHADHRIEPEEEFEALMRDAAALAAETGDLLTIGVVPDRPETGYGYIELGDVIARAGGTEALRVRTFHEKPDAETASAYVKRGLLWNSGLFVWRADRFLEEIRAHAPEIASALAHLEAGDVEGFFDACPSVAVDTAVLESSDRVAVVRASFEWDDVGSWAALARTRPQDADGNVVVGEAHLVESRDTIVATDGDPIAVFGVEGLVVVRASGVTLVTTREKAPDLKRLLERLPPDFRNPSPEDPR